VRRADRIRRLRMKSKSEFGREALLSYVELKEQELGLLKPQTEQVAA
jgi:hypothetical protein